MDKWILKLLYTTVLFRIFTYCSTAWVIDDDDSSCKTTEKCVAVRQCGEALENLKSTGSPNLKRCGFINDEEQVCCPSNSILTNNPPRISIKRKCEKACEELANATVKSWAGFNIIRGKDAEITDFPHMVILGYDFKEEGIQWNCGASIISTQFLLTAAHCISASRVKPSVARMGVTRKNDTNPQDYKVKKLIINNNYNSSTKHNDIALIEVATVITFSVFVAPACLYFENDDPRGLVITGWGKTEVGIEDDRSNILQKALVFAAPLKDCNISYFTKSSGSKSIIGSQICAGSDGNQIRGDACLGDSGGPLQVSNNQGTYSIVGIISYGAGCGGKAPGIYTRVSKYLDWIESIVWPNE